MLNQFKNLGTPLSKSELRNILGGHIMHGSCANGTTFTFEYYNSASTLAGVNEIAGHLNDFNDTVCSGSGNGVDIMTLYSIEQ